VAPAGTTNFWTSPRLLRPSPMKNTCRSCGSSRVKSREADVEKFSVGGGIPKLGSVSSRNTPTTELIGAYRSDFPCSGPTKLCTMVERFPSGVYIVPLPGPLFAVPTTESKLSSIPGVSLTPYMCTGELSGAWSGLLAGLFGLASVPAPIPASQGLDLAEMSLIDRRTRTVAAMALALTSKSRRPMIDANSSDTGLPRSFVRRAVTRTAFGCTPSSSARGVNVRVSRFHVPKSTSRYGSSSTTAPSARLSFAASTAYDRAVCLPNSRPL
jgi:hypothetical protein